MKNKVRLLLIVLLLVQCSRKESGREIESSPDSTSTLTILPKKIDTVNYNHSYQTCRCDWKLQRFNHYTDLSFSNNGKRFNVDSLFKWKNNPARLQIKSLGLIDFDTIPAELAIFENVESVYLLGINHMHVQGLEVFPHLRILKAEAENFDFNRNSKWLRNIEVIHVNKTRFWGIASFKQLPNLREVRLSFSGFDSFPADFETLNCLAYFQTGASMDREIDLTKLDLSMMKCLNYLEFHSWGKNIKGIPRGIDNIETVKISHGNLTRTEKTELKKIQERK